MGQRTQEVKITSEENSQLVELFYTHAAMKDVLVDLLRSGLTMSEKVVKDLSDDVTNKFQSVEAYKNFLITKYRPDASYQNCTFDFGRETAVFT